MSFLTLISMLTLQNFTIRVFQTAEVALTLDGTYAVLYVSYIMTSD